MYEDVGHEIKMWAQVLVVLFTLPFAFLGIALGFLIAEFNTFVGILAGLGVALFGYFLARLFAILFYGFGELVEKICAIESRISGKPAKEKRNVVVTPKKTREEKNNDGSWICPFCDHTNSPDSSYCGKCGFESILE